MSIFRNERNGLLLLIGFLILSVALCAWLTSGGQAIGNIFENLIVYEEDPHTPVIESQLALIKQTLDGYWLISTATLVTGVVTLMVTLGYVITQRRVPRSWSLLLILVGAAPFLVAVLSLPIQETLRNIPTQSGPFASGGRDSFLYAINLLLMMGAVGGILIIIGLAILLGAFWWNKSSAQRSIST